MKRKLLMSILTCIVIATAIYCANILRKQEPFWGSVEVAAHTAGKAPRPCPPYCGESPNVFHVEHAWYGWNGKLVRKTLF